MPQLISQLAPGQLAWLRFNGYVNGFGPRTWKFLGHSWRVTWLSILTTDEINALSDQHDLDYYLGGTEDDRLKADERMRDAMLALAKTKWFGYRVLLEAEAKLFFAYLRENGTIHFRHSPMARSISSIPELLIKAAVA